MPNWSEVALWIEDEIVEMQNAKISYHGIIAARSLSWMARQKAV